jgi:hypothetical protein
LFFDGGSFLDGQDGNLVMIFVSTLARPHEKKGVER